MNDEINIYDKEYFYNSNYSFNYDEYFNNSIIPCSIDDPMSWFEPFDLFRSNSSNEKNKSQTSMENQSDYNRKFSSKLSPTIKKKLQSGLSCHQCKSLRIGEELAYCTNNTSHLKNNATNIKNTRDK